MNWILKHEGEGVMPKELRDILDKHEKTIIEYRNEPDKMAVYFGAIKKEMVNWFADNVEAEV